MGFDNYIKAKMLACAFPQRVTMKAKNNIKMQRNLHLHETVYIQTRKNANNAMIREHSRM